MQSLGAGGMLSKVDAAWRTKLQMTVKIKGEIVDWPNHEEIGPHWPRTVWIIMNEGKLTARGR